MKQPKLSELVMNKKSTQEIRAKMKKAKKIKITINIDENSLSLLRKLSGDTGAPYQNLLNQILKEGLSKRSETESRLEKIEKAVEKLKKKVAA